MAEDQQQGVHQILQSAQAVLEEGQHRETIAACQHVLGHYPDAITALRLLGEALLEAGRAEEAARTFEKVLTAEPYNVLARVGLGVIAEDRGEDERAIAQFRLAWELEPTLPQLRGELVRLYRKRYGMGGRLRMTRIALANLHAHNDNLLRAIRQFAVLHEEDPTRLDVTLGWAVALWRHNDDAEAVTVCQMALAERPRLVRALLILAAISGDGGAVAALVPKSTEELLTIIDELDPDRALARHLMAFRTSPTLTAFAEQRSSIAAFDPTLIRIAGTDELLSQHLVGDSTRQISWDELADSWATGVADAAPATASIAQAPGASSYLDDDVDALFAAIDRQLAHGPQGTQDGVAPFDVDALAADPGQQIADELPEEPPASWETPEDDLMMPTAGEPTAVELLTANWDNIDNELEAARPSEDAALPDTGMLSDVGLDLQPFDVDTAGESEAAFTFDPAKFSLPPLDDDEEEDPAITDALSSPDFDLDVTPLSLADVGGKTKTNGLTFADLVEHERPAADSKWADSYATETPARITDVASIFATRELSSLSEDQLLEFQIAAPEQTTPWTESPLAPAPEPSLASMSPAEEGALSAALPQPPSPSAAVDALLSAETPRLILPESNYPADGTRPLLADEAISFGVQTGRETAAFTTLSQEGSGDDHLFSRLRLRRHDRVQSSDLLSPQPAAPASPTAESDPFAAITPYAGQDDVVVAATLWSESAPQTPAQSPEPDAWLATLAMPATPATSAPLPEEPAPPSPPLHDDWLEGLVEDAALTTGTWQTTAEVPAADRDDWSDLPAWPTVAASDEWLVAEPEPATARETPPEASGPGQWEDQPEADYLANQTRVWDTETPSYTPRSESESSAPEQPAPPEAPTHAAPTFPTASPTWADEVPNPLVARQRPQEVAPTPPVAPEAPMRHGEDWLVTSDRPANGMPLAVAAKVLPPQAPLQPPAPAAPARKRAVATHAATAAPGAAPAPTAGGANGQLAALEGLVAADPQNHFARLTLAVAYSGDRPEQALTEYRRLIKEDDELIPEVIERLKEMIADGDAPPRAHRVLGDAYMKLEQYDLAMAEFQRALTTRPKAGR